MIGQDKFDNYQEISELVLRLSEIARSADNNEIVVLMKKIVPEFKSMNSVFETLDSKSL